MKVQRIQIEQQMVKLEINSRLASISVDAPRRRMKIERQDAQLSIEREAPDIEIDMQDFRDNCGQKDIGSFMGEITAKAQSNARRSIQEKASDGDFVGALPGSGNSIGRLAKSKLLEVDPPVMNSGRVPYGAVKMKGNIGDIDINWSRHDIRIEWDDFQTPQITVEPKASVDINVAQEPYLEFTVVEESIPAEKGTAIDAAV
ncbi:MAG: hypothetical protein EOM54_02345 [Clostridia bacterium]|nr:hypothetical protein [Clostridia bacterium]